jgi:predicted nucleic acid-binding protein
MTRFAISDASPLIGLALIDGLQWLPKLFGRVWVTESVEAEVLPLRPANGKQEIAAAFEAGWLNRFAGPIIEKNNSALLDELDRGERDSILLGLMQPKNSVILLIDERLGRSVASEAGLRIVGTAGLIGTAKKRGFIHAARPVFAQLHSSDFRISAEVIKTVLSAVGED